MKIFKIVGIYQIVGAIFGIFALFSLLLPKLEYNDTKYYILFFLSLYLLVGASGFFLLQKDKGKGSFTVSILAQLVQIINFSIEGFEYDFQIGAVLGFIFKESISVVLNLYDPLFKLSFVSEESFIVVNFFPMVLIFLLKKEFDKGQGV